MGYKRLTNILKWFGLGIFLFLLTGCELVMFDPVGPVAKEQKWVILLSVGLMLLVVIPVIVLTLLFAWKYRAGNTRAKYSPEWAHSYLLEFIWWTGPCIIILILAVITWISSHELDPYRPIKTANTLHKKPLIIQVISLDWKWLFIYPEQNIATVNFLEIPKDQLVQFKVTSDAPMNSFWIPQLGSQIMSMQGMETKLHTVGTKIGTYRGYSALYSGAGFSGMEFDIKVAEKDSFEQWVDSVKNSPHVLTLERYVQLAKPSESDPVTYYSSVEKNLYSDVVMHYMMPGGKLNILKNQYKKVTQD